MSELNNPLADIVYFLPKQQILLHKILPLSFVLLDDSVHSIVNFVIRFPLQDLVYFEINSFGYVLFTEHIFLHLLFHPRYFLLPFFYFVHHLLALAFQHVDQFLIIFFLFFRCELHLLDFGLELLCCIFEPTDYSVFLYGD